MTSSAPIVAGAVVFFGIPNSLVQKLVYHEHGPGVLIWSDKLLITATIVFI
jgi:hypothetical protein